MPTISEAELMELLNGRKGAAIVSIVTRTSPEMRKTANPYFGRVTKVSKVLVMVGWSYENAVNAQRLREAKDGDVVDYFESQPRKWGSRIKGTPFVEHKGAYYLEAKVQRSLGCQYEMDGKVIDPEILKPFMKERSSAANQGVEREVIVRDYRLSSIEQVTIADVTYVVRHEVDQDVASYLKLLEESA